MNATLKRLGLCALIGVVGGVTSAATNAVLHAGADHAQPLSAVQKVSDVLPEFDNHPDQDTRTVVDNGTNWVFYIARKSGRGVGAAVASSSRRGYAGAITVLVGIQTNDTVRGIAILSQHETPGLGTRIKESGFRSQFAERPVKATNWRLKKDGGDLDAITSATISSRAVTEAVRRAVDVYVRHASEVFPPENPDTPAATRR